MAFNVQTLDAAKRRIEAAQRGEAVQYWCVVAALGVFFLVGIALLLLAAWREQATLGVTGVLVEFAIIWPIRQMNSLRQRQSLASTVLALLPLLNETVAEAKVVEVIDLFIREAKS